MRVRQNLNEYFVQQDQESRTFSFLRDQIMKLLERLEFIEHSKKSSKVLTHREVLAVPTFHIKLLSPRVPESLAANRECFEIHVFPETSLIVNLPDECLSNYIMIQEIWQHHWGFREEKELRKVEVKNHCNQYLYLACRQEQRKKVWTTEIVLSL